MKAYSTVLPAWPPVQITLALRVVTDARTDRKKFTCTQCADEHDVLDVSFGANEPYAWLELSGDNRSA